MKGLFTEVLQEQRNYQEMLSHPGQAWVGCPRLLGLKGKGKKQCFKSPVIGAGTEEGQTGAIKEWRHTRILSWCMDETGEEIPQTFSPFFKLLNRKPKKNADQMVHVEIRLPGHQAGQRRAAKGLVWEREQQTETNQLVGKQSLLCGMWLRVSGAMTGMGFQQNEPTDNLDL